MKIHTRLTYGLLNEYGNRKVPGRLSILVDTSKYECYAVPRNVEHIDFVKKMRDVSEIIPETVKSFVPVHIQLEPNQKGIEEVVGVSVGYSGLEIKAKVRHSKKSLEKAHEIAWSFINFGEVPVGEIKEDRIDYKYSSD